MPKQKQDNKISQQAADINKQLENAPAPKVQVYPEILTRDQTVAEKEKEKQLQTGN